MPDDSDWIECRVDLANERAAFLDYMGEMGITIEDGDMHFDVPKFLRYNRWPDTPENRDTACEAMREAAAVLFPGTPVVETRRANPNYGN
jgi:hypothetical protein